MNARRSKFTIELTVETTGLNADDHQRRVRWAARNAMSANADFPDAFVVVRDEDGALVEFQGSGRAKPSASTEELLTSLMAEQGSTTQPTRK